MLEIPETKEMSEMRKSCKIVFCVGAILLFGVFSQDETMAGEAVVRYYSRPYSVLSANVGNSRPLGLPGALGDYEIILKLQDADYVIPEIVRLKPDIMILIETLCRSQVRNICQATKEEYDVHGPTPPRDYDFICVKNAIGDVIKHKPMPGGNGNSVGYVDVRLKDEGGRKVRLFYVHFPSPGGGWTVDLHKAHTDAFNWICDNLESSIPNLIAGDLNNDFIVEKDDDFNLWCPVESAVYNSSRDIFRLVNDNNLRILNPKLTSPKGEEYEPTHRLWDTTIDWVIGNEFVDGSFVTSEPDWWRGTSPLVLDHKPLYGEVRFLLEEWETAKWPFDPILVIDRSGSIQGVFGLMQGIENDAGTFVDQLLRRARQVAVINFSSRGDVHLDCRFSSDRARVLQAISNPSATSGGTALYQAVDEALNTSPAGGKTAVIVFSDGCENSSMISLEEAIRKAQERGVPVLTVGYIGHGGRNEDGLHQLAGSTHGFYERAEDLNVEEMLNRFSDYLQYKKTIAPVGGAF